MANYINSDTSNVASTISTQNVADNTVVNHIGPIIETLCVSLLLLLLVSVLKYHIEHKNESVDYWHFGLELPIDIGTVLISVFISYNYLVSNINCFLILLFLQLGAMVAEMILRNKALYVYIQSGTELPIKKLLGLLGGELFAMFIPIVVTLIII